MASSRHKRQKNRALIALRVNAGFSRVDLERKTGVSRETIRLAELGFVPSVRTQFALAAAFGQLPLDIWPLERQPVLA